MERISVPFSYRKLNSTWTNYTHVSGLLHTEVDALVVEFHEKSTDFNTMAEEKSPLHTVRIPLGEIESLTLRWRFPWGRRLVLSAHSLAVLDGLPNSDGPIAWFDVAWNARMRAREFTSTATLHLLDRRLKELGEGEL